MSPSSEDWEQNRSVWQLTAESIAFSPLAANDSADVCIVGGDIAGLSVAYELARAGRSVIPATANAAAIRTPSERAKFIKAKTIFTPLAIAKLETPTGVRDLCGNVPRRCYKLIDETGEHL